MQRIKPSTAARLRFFVTDPTTGAGALGLVFGDIATAGYATFADGVQSSTTSITLSSTTTATAAIATGQLIEIGLGEYAIDVPAVGASGEVLAVVAVTGKEVRSVAHTIDEAVSTRSDHAAAAVVSGLQAVANDFKADISGIFDDADVAQLLADISAKFDEASDLPIQTIRAAVVSGLQAVADDFKADAAPTVAAIADAVWDESKADHTTAGTYGEFAITVGNVTVASFTAAALLQLVTDDTGQTTAAAGSVARIAQGSAADITAELQTIIAQTSLISGSRIDVVSPVSPGGAITIYRGSDYRVRSTTAIALPVTDAGGVLAALLKTDSISAIIFGAGDADSANSVVGSIEKDGVTNTDDVTTLLIEIEADQIKAAAGCLEYHIKSVTGDGDECVRIDGTCEVREKRATP